MLRVRTCERIKVWIQMTMIGLERSDERADFIIFFFRGENGLYNSKQVRGQSLKFVPIAALKKMASQDIKSSLLNNTFIIPEYLWLECVFSVPNL